MIQKTKQTDPYIAQLRCTMPRHMAKLTQPTGGLLSFIGFVLFLQGLVVILAVAWGGR